MGIIMDYQIIIDIINEMILEDIESGGYIYSCIIMAAKRSIMSHMYGLYSPKYYKRRYGSGGLGDMSNIRILSESTGDGVEVEIINEAPYPAMGKRKSIPDVHLDEFMEEGMGKPYIPRPFYDALEEVWDGLFSSKTEKHLINRFIEERLGDLLATEV